MPQGELLERAQQLDMLHACLRRARSGVGLFANWNPLVSCEHGGAGAGH